MRHISFDPSKLTATLKAEWDAWEATAEKAREDAIEAWEKWKSQPDPQSGKKQSFVLEFNNRVWGQLKEWLLKNVFNGKCGYCETGIIRSPGDAEHFRPKGRVTVRPSVNLAGKTIGKKTELALARDESDNQTPHPGYFWLAYNWKNLLPSCEACNRGVGKRDLFPVNKDHVLLKKLTDEEVLRLKAPPYPSKSWAGCYYLQPEDLDAIEDPLLLHPYFDDPREHLVFGDCGIVAARDGSAKGEYSIDVYGLSDEGLRIQRQKVQEQAKMQYFGKLAFSNGTIDQQRFQARESMKKFIDGEEPYSCAALDYLKLWDIAL